MFRVSTTPIIRSTQNCNYSLRYGSYFLCSYLPPTWPSLATFEGGSCRVPEAVVTVLCTPDDGCVWHPKHVEWTCRIINRLLRVASRWAVINFVAVYMLLTRYNKAVYNVSSELAPLCYGPRHYSGSSSGEDELEEPVGHLFCWQTDSGPVCVTQ